MKKKEIRKLAIVYLLLLVIAIGMDLTNGNISSNQTIVRDEVGSDTRTVELVVDAKDWLEDYTYILEVMPQKVTKEQADIYFKETIKLIDKEFSEEWIDVPVKNQYLNGMIGAEWRFVPTGYLSSDGALLCEEIPQEGVIVTAHVTMECGEYEQVYTFPFRMKAKELSQEEKLKKALKEWFETQFELEGTADLYLPQELLGIPLEWSEKKEYLWAKILFLEVVSVLLIVLSKKKKKELEIAERRREAELQYAGLVGLLQVLLEAGMTTRQAWEKIADQYSMKKQRNLVKETYVYEVVLHMVRRFQEGENERSVYQYFLKEVDVLCYRRLMRMLLGNLNKGNRDVCRYLKEEAQQAYEQRVLLAKRLGEEASTKMLIPLMLMMVLVMGIVMIPAIISFSI